MRAALILPARNEAETIPGVIAEVRRFFDGPIVVADNGSSDLTADRARAAGARTVAEPVPGYGRACMAGVAAVRDADVLVFMDADGSDCPEEIPRLLAAIESGADLALAIRRGARVEPGSIAPAARFGNWLSCGLIRLGTGRRLHDLSPLKAVRREAFEAIGPTEMTYGWTVELLAVAAGSKLRIAEIETGYRHRRGGESKVSGNLVASAKAGYRILFVLARLAFRRGGRRAGLKRR